MEKEIDVDPAEFAEYLRAERERRQLTLDQIADETKIASRHLAALERGDVRNWPGGMYRRAMMRAYAESIGVDREFALHQFEKAFEPKPAPPPAPLVPATPDVAPASHSRAIGLVTIGFVVAALAIAGWRAASGPSQSVSRTEPVPVAAAAAPAPASAPAAPPPVALARVASTTAAPAPVEPAAPAPRPTTEGAAATAGTTPPAPAPARAPVALATEGNLRVTTTPAGARVTVNGIGWGEAPIVIKNLPFGAKRVRVTMDGYISQERVVQLSAGQPDVRVTLALRARE
jgi:cytoskeleton protein RodZ